MSRLAFTDERIDDILSGRSPMTAEERSFLIEDTPSFEECDDTPEALAALTDIELMGTAYRVWSDYVSCM